MPAPNSPPLVTIGITCFNAEDTIERALNSALAQDWPNIEIVVADDGSSDGSRALLERLSQTHTNVKVLLHDGNKGFPAALNTIIAAANGEFVSFFDDDDVSEPNRLSAQLSRLLDYEARHEGARVFCYCNRHVMPAGATVPQALTLAIGRHAPEPFGEMVAENIFCLLAPQPWVWGQFGSGTLLIRRANLQQLGPFDESFRRCAEWDLAVRAAFDNGHFIAVDEPLMTQHLTARADKADKAPLRYALKLRHKHKQYLRKKGLYEASIAMTHARFYYAKGARWKSRCFIVLACAMAPRKLLPRLLAQRRAARSAAHATS